MSQSIVELIRMHGQEALKNVYLEHRDEFISWARRQMHCSADQAKDAYQQAIIILYENIVNAKLVMLQSSEKTYLFAIGKNKLREMLREDVRFQNLDSIDYMELGAEEEPVDPKKLRHASECLQHLGEPCKRLLEEFYYHQSTMTRIAEKLGYKNEDAAKSQKYKCLARLRKLFNHELVMRPE